MSGFNVINYYILTDFKLLDIAPYKELFSWGTRALFPDGSRRICQELLLCSS